MGDEEINCVEIKLGVYCSECHQLMVINANATDHEDGSQLLSVKPCATGCVDLGNILENCLSFHGTDETDDDGRPLP